jgi:hypothetical protein
MSDTLKAPGDKRMATATEGDSTARGCLGGTPRGGQDVRTRTYSTTALNGIASEQSPSTGWRGVYAAMGVGVR